MSALDDLTERLSGAAVNPPKLIQDKVIVANPRPILPPTSSTGVRRPVLRVSVGQSSQIRDRATYAAEAEARRTLIAQARKEIIG